MWRHVRGADGDMVIVRPCKAVTLSRSLSAIKKAFAMEEH